MRVSGVFVLWALFFSCACKNSKTEPAAVETRSGGAPPPHRSPDQQCDDGDFEACRKLGVARSRGEGADPAGAAALFERACAGGNAPACSNLGLSYMTGHGVPKDAKRGAELYASACTKGHGLGCRNLGLAHLRGNGVPPDAARAVELFQSACESGTAMACTNWGMALRDGVGTAIDGARSVELLLSACNGGDAAGCRHLGGMYATGQAGLTASQDAAVIWFDKACVAGDARGCTALGLLQVGNPDTMALARKNLGKACDAAEIVACEEMVKRGWAERSVETAGLRDAGPLP